MATSIIVNESAKHYESPERATVNIDIKYTSFDREKAHQRVSEVLRDVRAQIEGMHDGQNGPVTWYSISGASTWTSKDADGFKFSEEIEVKVKFSDFARLGNWLDSVLKYQGVRLRFIRWSVTQHREKELEALLRQAAVRAARQKAEQYAAAVGMHIVSIKTIADTGFLKNGYGYSSASSAASRGGGGASGSASSATLDTYRFAPEDIHMSASVEAEFLAD